MDRIATKVASVFFYYDIGSSRHWAVWMSMYYPKKFGYPV